MCAIKLYIRLTSGFMQGKWRQYILCYVFANDARSPQTCVSEHYVTPFSRSRRSYKKLSETLMMDDDHGVIMPVTKPEEDGCQRSHKHPRGGRVGFGPAMPGSG